MHWTRRDWLALVLITCLAAALRLYQLGVVPPGFQFDEAFNAIDARGVLAGNRPLFLPANAGREVVYTYVQASLIRLFGLNVWTLRLASALFGTLAVPLAYVLLRVILRRDSRRIALFTSLTLAISLWHIHFSHYGIRVIMMPVIFSLAFGAYWLGHHAETSRRRIAAYAASGLLIGLSVWTHPTGRLAPFVPILFTLWLLWRNPDARPAGLRLQLDSPLGGLFLTGVLAFIVFLPLGIEFYRHPEFFVGHASEVSVFAERVSGDSPLAALAANVLHVLGMFSVAGDWEWTHNLAGRPVFDLLMAAAYFLGIGIWALRLNRAVRTRGRVETDPAKSDAREPDADALFLLLTWALVMLLPSVLSEAAPNYSRTLPSLPALFVAGGLGLAWVSHLQRPHQYAGIAAAALILLYSGYRAVYDYFVVFPDRQEVYYLYDADKLDALAYLQTLTAGSQVYLSQLWGDHHATVSMLRREMNIKSLDASDTLALPPPDMGVVFAFPHEQLERAEQLAKLWPHVQVRQVDDPFGAALLYLVEVDLQTAAQLPAAYEPLQTNAAAFVDAPDLLGLYAADPDKQITLLWEADEPYTASLTSYIHLIDPDGRRVAQIDKLPGNGSYPTTAWTVGERVFDRYYPSILDPCTGGIPLRAKVGWYALAEDHAPRPRADAPGDTALAGVVTLLSFSHAPGYLQPQVSNEQPVTNELSFLGFNFTGSDLEPGSPIVVDLYWRSDHAGGSHPPSAALPIAMRLDNDGVSTAIWQGELAPMSDWDPGKELCRRVRLQIPVDTPPGTYTLQAQLPGATQDALWATDLLELEVRASTRLFEQPDLEVAAPAHFVDAGDLDEISLLGARTSTATLDGLSPSLDLTLVWQAQTSPHGNYKAFVHLLDAEGAIVAQSDATPGPDYPTNRWLAGEVVLDSHQLELPSGLTPGVYTVVTGLYDPISAERLNASADDGQPLPDNRAVVQQISVTD
ncbi:MAG: phospholipid carrier-dependent glycosyltransferase [Chloroflexota bacterium]|nr:phospholipid carrier-dependent glycosyltransferase [Chloroflexota bacterium]